MFFLRRHFFLFALIAYATLIFFLNYQHFTSAYDAKKELSLYLNSQYYQGEKSSYILSDAQTYAIRAYQYLNQFQDPETILPGHPPLGTYLIGLSLVIFNNPNLLSLFVGLLTLLVTYHLASILFPKQKLLALLPPLFLAADPLFTEQLSTSMLDIYSLLFVTTCLYFYLRFRVNKQFHFIATSSFFFGLAASSKFFFGVIPLFTALLISTVTLDNFKLFTAHIKSLCFIALGFFLGHFSYFFYHPSLLSFMRYQRYLISWWAGSPRVAPFAVFDLIFTGAWHTWWGSKEVVKLSSWWVGLPISLTLSLLHPLTIRPKSLFSSPSFPLWLFLIFTLLFFSLSATYPRHLLIILPTIYLLSIFSIFKLLKTLHRR